MIANTNEKYEKGKKRKKQLSFQLNYAIVCNYVSCKSYLSYASELKTVIRLFVSKNINLSIEVQKCKMK